MFVFVEKAIASSMQQNKAIVYKLTVRESQIILWRDKKP